MEIENNEDSNDDIVHTPKAALVDTDEETA